jgi:autoinducer 2 (AI-2) kinase
MAIDAGTGSVRAVIFDTKGNQVSFAQKEWVHLGVEGVKNSMSFDFKHNWELVKWCIKESIKKANLKPEEIMAISATSMREGIVLYDENGEELWAVANVDARADKEVKELKEKFPEIEAKFYQQSGQTFALGAIPRLLWLKNNQPKIYEKVAKVSMIGDWVLAKLSGKIATDPSNAGTTGIFSLIERDWTPEMAKKVGLKDDIFASCMESGAVIGKVIPRAVEELGLYAKTLVVMGGGDVQLGAAGLGVVNVGEVAILGGSFWQQVVNTPHDTPPPKDMSIRVNPHVVDDMNQAEGITFFSGLVMRWFRDAFCEMEKLQADKEGVDVYEILEKKAMDIPVGSYGIIPIFSDSMKYSKWYHASPSFLNLSLDANKCNKASMFRSLQENACIVSSINLEKIKEFSGIEISEIVFAGGASKGKLWPQILADVTGCSVKIPLVKESTALGAAMAAAIGCEMFYDMQEASNAWVKFEKTYTPNMQNKKIYDEIKIKWQEAYEEQLKLVDKNITTSMWKAPGL